jgi:hypothetical protein
LESGYSGNSHRVAARAFLAAQAAPARTFCRPAPALRVERLGVCGVTILRLNGMVPITSCGVSGTVSLEDQFIFMSR